MPSNAENSVDVRGADGQPIRFPQMAALAAISTGFRATWRIVSISWWEFRWGGGTSLSGAESVAVASIIGARWPSPAGVGSLASANASKANLSAAISYSVGTGEPSPSRFSTGFFVEEYRQAQHSASSSKDSGISFPQPVQVVVVRSALIRFCQLVLARGLALVYRYAIPE